MYNVTFQQIEVFLTVSKYMNLSKAAEVMFTSQSALSRTLRRFEEGVGMHLFKRSNQGLEFTPEGEYLYSTLGTINSSFNKIIQSAQDISGANKRYLNIAVPSSFDSSSTFKKAKDLISKFKFHHPEVTTRETLMDFRDLRQALEFGTVNIAFALDFSINDIENVSCKPVSTYKLKLAVSIDHPLAKYDILPYGMPENEFFFTVPIYDDTNAHINPKQICKKIGVTPRSVELVPNFQTLLHNVACGNGVAVCAEFDRLQNENIKYIEFPDSITDCEYSVVVGWLNGYVSDEARMFLNMI